MNPPPRTGISRDCGSVMLRTGPGPLAAAALAAALRSAWAARALALSSFAAACRTRQYWLAGRRGGSRSGVRACLIFCVRGDLNGLV